MKEVIIKTDRLTLCPLGTEYLESVYEYSSDLETTRLMAFLPQESIEETEQFLRECEAEWRSEQPSFCEFAVIYEGRQIGSVGLYHEGEGAVEFGWILNKAYHGRGIATEAASALMDFAKNEMGAAWVFAQCDSENAASYSVMEKLGMKRVSVSGGRRNRSSDEERTEYTYELVF